MGFFLRVAFANGMSLARLLKCSGHSEQVWLTDEQLRLLSCLADVRQPDLDPVVCRRTVQGARREFSYLGHRWMSSDALRARCSPVCPYCLQAAPFVRTIWGITGYCACVEHGVLLLDTCPRCARPLDWNRLAPDVCRCGCYLGSASVAPASPDILVWSSWFRARCMGIDHPGVDDEGAMGAFGALTPDGAYQLGMALGRLSELGAQTEVVSPLKAPTVAQVSHCLRRALARLLEIQTADDATRALGQYVDEPRLQRLARHGVQVCDRQAAQRWLHRLYRERRHDDHRDGRYGPRQPRGQLELFDDAGHLW